LSSLLSSQQQQQGAIKNKAYSLPVSGAANNGSGLIRLTTASHMFKTGDRVTVASVGGTTEANGAWFMTKASGSTLDLNGSTFTNAYTSGGTVKRGG
jgi:hypothetical protein